MYYIIAVVIITALIVGYLIYRNNKTKVGALAATVLTEVKADLAMSEKPNKGTKADKRLKQNKSATVKKPKGK